MIILLAEDEALVAFVLDWALRLAGHEILGPVETIEEALAAVERRRADLALVNLTLKDGQDGADLARQLRSIHQIPSVFVATDVSHARANREAAIGLIKKPYDADMVPAGSGTSTNWREGAGRPGHHRRSRCSGSHGY